MHTYEFMRLLFFQQLFERALACVKCGETERERDRAGTGAGGKWNEEKKSRTEIIHAIIVYTNEVPHKKQKHRNFEANI